MKLKKCPECKTYTMKNLCPKCNSKTEDAHYKFIEFSKKTENQIQNNFFCSSIIASP